MYSCFSEYDYSALSALRVDARLSALLDPDLQDVDPVIVALSNHARSDEDLVSDASMNDRRIFIRRREQELERVIRHTLNVSGDNVVFGSPDYTRNGIAAPSLIQHWVELHGVIRIGGNNCVLSGIKFVSPVENHIHFHSNCQHITFVDCTFTCGESDLFSTASLLVQNNSLFSGDVTFKGCVFQNYG